MRRMFIIIILGFFVTSLCEAKIYVALDKQTGDPQGTVDIDERTVGEWAKGFIMLPADESYRGLQGYEIKYDNKKLRRATIVEIDSYKNDIDNRARLLRKQNILDELGITESELNKLKGQ